MKVVKLLQSALLCMAIAGCGGQSSDERVSAPALRMKKSGSAIPTDNSGAYSIAGYRNNFTITNTDGIVTVTSRINASDVRTYQNPKLIKFADKWTSFEVSGEAGQVYRLYQAAFNRKPDLEGLGFWIKANQDGASLTDMAGGFIGSDEFKKMYGDNPPASAFIDAMYQNVLHRAGEPDGFNWWVQQVDAGADRRGVLIGFADSNENKAALLPDMANGFDYVPYNVGGPIIPKSSSYANAKEMNIGPQAFPSVWGGTGSYEAITAGAAFGDFFQNGQLAMVGFSNVFAGQNGYGSTVSGKVYFFQKDANGKWVDNTARLIVDRTGCISPRKLVVADFNGDGKPDVFAACHGIDGNVPAGFKQGEHPRMLLSQADGTYKNIDMGFDCYCHGASAAELNGIRGYADIAVVDPAIAKEPYVLINNRDGTFAPDHSKTPEPARKFNYPGQTEYFGRAIYTTELIDVNGDGKFDWLLAGDEDGAGQSAWQAQIYIAGSTGFDSGAIVLPPQSSYPITLDVVRSNSQLMLLKVSGDYSKYAVQQIDLKTQQQLNKFSGLGADNVWLTQSENIVSALNSVASFFLRF